MLRKTYWSLILASLVFVSCSKEEDEDEAKTVTLKGSTESSSALRVSTDGIDPSSVQIKVRKVVAFESEYCDESGAAQIIYETTADDAVYVDFSDAPTIGSGDISDGTYKCIGIEMWDVIKFEPSETSTNGICAVGTEYDLDVFMPQGEDYQPVGQLLDGTAVDGEDAGQWVGIYLSTASENANDGSDEDANPFVPTSANSLIDGMTLTSELVVNASTTAAFVADFAGKIEEGGDESTCDCQAPSWGFEKITE